MTYEDFETFVREQCMYETIYDDSDGRRILVMRLLDAYGMVNKAVAAEREACVEEIRYYLAHSLTAKDILNAIRERGEK